MDIFSFGMCALEVLAPRPPGLQLPAPAHRLTMLPLPLCLTWPCPQMAVLEIQANGDTRVTEEAIARARHSLSDPNMRVIGVPCPSQLAVSETAGLGVQWVRAAEGCAR